MQETDLIILQEVHSHEEAADVQEILVANNVGCKLIESDASFDPSTGVSTEKKLSIQVLRTDYEKARDVLMRELEKADQALDAEHYFNDYSNEELLDVIKSEDEWSPEDVVHARKMLQERKVEWNEEEIFSINEAKRNAKDNPETVSTPNLIGGFVLALLGGLLGIGMGWYLMALKKDSRDGNRIFVYDEKTRKAGRLMLFVGVSTAIVVFYFYFTQKK